MPTKLQRPVIRATAKRIQGRPIIVTLAPLGGQDEALVGLRLQGTRTEYVCRLSDLYRVAALWHGQKVQAAKRKARKDGVPWKDAKRQFTRANRIPVRPQPRKSTHE